MKTSDLLPEECKAEIREIMADLKSVDSPDLRWEQRKAIEDKLGLLKHILGDGVLNDKEG